MLPSYIVVALAVIERHCCMLDAVMLVGKPERCMVTAAGSFLKRRVPSPSNCAKGKKYARLFGSWMGRDGVKRNIARIPKDQRVLCSGWWMG